MEEKIIRKRSQLGLESKYNLMDKLAILLRTHKETKYLCSSTSVAYRVAGLCDLAINKYIEVRSGQVNVIKSHNNPILNDFLIKIAQVNGNPIDVIKSLNGEKRKENSIKNLKTKLYKEIDKYDVIIKEKGYFQNKIILKDNEVWKKIFDDVVDQCINNRISLDTKVLLLCLEYINDLHDILIHLPKVKADHVLNAIAEVRSELINNSFSKVDELVYSFMKYLCRNKIFIF